MRWIFLILLFSFSNLFAEEVNLFTTRHYESDIKIYKKFTEKTGIKVNVVAGKSKKPLEKRILEEGKDCIGDIFFLADVGRLISAEKKIYFKKFLHQFLKVRFLVPLDQNIGLELQKGQNYFLLSF